MSEQPDPTIGETVFLPDYVVEVAELLAATEKHRDAGVRAIRKIVIQAAIALDHAQAACPPACRECGCTDGEACPGGCEWVGDDLCSACDTEETSGSDATATAHPSHVTNESTSTSEPEPTHRPSQVERMAALGVTAADVREWAIEQGMTVSTGGRIRNELIDAYESDRAAAA